jgi:hypothetical protein
MTNNIYPLDSTPIHALAKGKLKKLSYRNGGYPELRDWHDKSLTRTQLEYKLVNWLFRQRFNQDDIRIVLGAWWKRHHLRPNWTALNTQIIPDCWAFTFPVVQARRHEEYLRRKEKKRQQNEPAQQHAREVTN